MRATVERPNLASIRGVNIRRTSASAWLLGFLLAGIAGVAGSPLFSLDPATYTGVLFVAATAAVLGRLRSIPIAFAGGLLLGIGQSLFAGYVVDRRHPGPGRLDPVHPALRRAASGSGTERTRVAGSVADVAPPPDYLRGLPLWRRALPWAVATGLLIYFVMGPASAFDVGPGAARPGVRPDLPVVRAGHRRRRHGQPGPVRLRPRLVAGDGLGGERALAVRARAARRSRCCDGARRARRAAGAATRRAVPRAGDAGARRSSATRCSSSGSRCPTATADGRLLRPVLGPLRRQQRAAIHPGTAGRPRDRRPAGAQLHDLSERSGAGRRPLDGGRRDGGRHLAGPGEAAGVRPVRGGRRTRRRPAGDRAIQRDT